jgi:hypothetical protein
MSDGPVVRVSRRLADTARDWIGSAPAGAERGERAARFILEVARLVAPALRLRAQLLLEALPEAEQLRHWEAAHASEPAELDESVGRLVALVARAQA